MLAVLGLTLFYIVTVVERKLVPWHVSQRLITQQL
jgi:ABC-type nitrate/sulfonate/bicarbonate transport system permease component